MWPHNWPSYSSSEETRLPAPSFAALSHSFRLHVLFKSALFVCMQLHTCAYVGACVHTCMHACACACVCVCVCVCVCACACICTRCVPHVVRRRLTQPRITAHSTVCTMPACTHVYAHLQSCGSLQASWGQGFWLWQRGTHTHASCFDATATLHPSTASCRGIAVI